MATHEENSVTNRDQNIDDDDISSYDGAATTISNVGTSLDVDDDSDDKIKLQQPINYP